jgi:hypothetical protein
MKRNLSNLNAGHVGLLKQRTDARRKTWEQKVERRQRQLMVEGYTAVDAFEIAKKQLAKSEAQT